MPSFTVDNQTPYAVNFGPLTEEEEILQNVATTLNVMIDSAVNSRQIGIVDNVDRLTTVVIAGLKQDVVEAIESGEPRATVETISLTADNSGTLNAQVIILI